MCPRFLLLGTIVLLILASFLPGMPKTINGIICMSLLTIGLLYTAATQKSLQAVVKPLREIDLDTILLLLGLFLVIGGITEQGVIDQLAALIARLGGSNLFVIYTVIVWASVLFSAFIDNIPYVATMLPVVQKNCPGYGCGPYGFVLWTPVWGHPGGQSDAHRRLCQHHQHWHPAQGRL